uniref:Uncharacterized protein n=1 Tax=Daphnia galeata TaxID=27404 RepID=A0A8J2WM59_9CRUS|nr:unnamed protein product [Daphnia galeata]
MLETESSVSIFFDISVSSKDEDVYSQRTSKRNGNSNLTRYKLVISPKIKILHQSFGILVQKLSQSQYVQLDTASAYMDSDFSDDHDPIAYINFDPPFVKHPILSVAHYLSNSLTKKH